MSVVKKCTRLASFFTLFFCAGLSGSATIQAQQKERTLDEVKAEAIKRAENGMYPLIGLDPADVREAFSSIKTSSDDEWAVAFSAVADRYMNEGKSLQSSDPTKANADYIRAWRLYSFA